MKRIRAEQRNGGNCLYRRSGDYVALQKICPMIMSFNAGSEVEIERKKKVMRHIYMN